MNRKIGVITGSRAEYGLLQLLIKEIENDAHLELQLYVTGAHLSEKHGHTVDLILKDGFKVTDSIPILSEFDQPIHTIESMSIALDKFGTSLLKNKPDIVVILGDRYEILPVAIACMILKIPIAHIHGGELTEGLIDDAIRHSVTKMSHLHFVACEEYRNRVIQLGESPDRVFNYGAMGIDIIQNTRVLDKNEVAKRLGLDWKEPTFLITYHPVTLSNQDPEIPIQNLLSSLDEFPKANLIFTKSNADSHASIINKAIDAYVEKNRSRAISSVSLGQELYLSTLRHATVAIGNSSSGIIEAPFLNIPTVNIGPRQNGRVKAESIIDCEDSRDDISKSIRLSLSPQLKSKISQMNSKYGSGNSSFQIKEKLKSHSLENILFKKFYNIEQPDNFMGKKL